MEGLEQALLELQQLLQTKRQAAMAKWSDGVKKSFAKQISYQAGYAPASTAGTTVPSIPAATTG